MKVAISTDGEYVSAHFGRCPAFTIIEIENGKITREETIDNPGHHPGFLPKFLNEMGVRCIIAGGMGNKAVTLFNQFDIKPILGITGTVRDAVEQIAGGTLEGGESLCQPGGGKGYGLDKSECDHGEDQ
jgi:predicted Fe-Mo cluster-binding NifX family protein